MRAGAIRVELELEDGRFTSRIIRASTSLGQLGRELGSPIAGIRRLDSATLGVGSTLTSLVTTIGLAKMALHNLWGMSGGWITGIIKTNAELERMETLMRGLSSSFTMAGAADDAKKSMQYVMDAAKQMPYSINTLNDVFVKFRAGGIDPTNGSMRSLINAVAAFGGTDAQLHRASIAIQQMAGKGVISMEELRQQLGEAVPSAIKLMARSVGMSMSELVEKVSRGQISASAALTRMFSEFELTFGGAAKTQMETFNGLLSRLQTEWIELQKIIGNAGGGETNGFFATVKKQLTDLILLMDDRQMLDFATSVGEGLKEVTLWTRQSMDTLISYKDTIVTVGTVMAYTFAASKAISFFSGIRNVCALAVAEIRMFGSAWTLLNTRIAASAAVLATSTSALTSMRAGLGMAAAGVRFFGAALSFLAGPVGIALGFLGMLAYELDLFQSRADRAGKVWKQFVNGIYNQETVDQGRKEIKVLEETIADKQKKLVNYQATMEALKKGNPDGWENDKAYKIASNMAESLRNNISSMERELDAGKKRVDEAAIELAQSAGERVGYQAARTIEAGTGNIQKAVTKQLEVIAQKYDEMGKLTPEQKKALFQERVQVIESGYGQVIDALRSKQAEASNELSTTTDAEAKARLKSTINTLQESVDRFEETRDRALKNQNDDGVLFFGGKDGVKKAKTKLDELTEGMARAGAAAKGMGTHMAELQVEIDRGDYASVPKEQLEQMITAAKGWDAAISSGKAEKAASRQEKEVGGIFEKIGYEISKAREQYEEYALEFGSGSSVLGTGYALLEAKVARWNNELKKAGASQGELIKFGKEMKEALNLNAANTLLQTGTSYKTATKQINQELATTLDQQRALRWAALDDEKKRLEEFKKLTLENTELTYEKKQELIATAEANIQALTQKTVRENETAIDKLMRDWSDKSKNMEDAAAKWIDSTADALAEFATTGKLDFKSLADSIISDIARMSVKSSMSSIWNSTTSSGSTIGDWITSALGLGGSSNSGLSSSDVKSISDSITFEAHTGGVIGADALKSRSINPSWFLGAQRYHTGGMVGGPSLSANEVPIIAKKGEGVFTEEQMTAMSGGTSANVQVNVLNNSGTSVTAEQSSPRIDGQSIILDVVLKAASQPGSFRNSMKSAMG